MKYLIAASLLITHLACQAGQGAEYVNGYFEIWLANHHFTQFEKQPDGIHFPQQGIVLDGEINEAKELKPGKFYSVESRISLHFKNGRRLDDFVGGVGSTANDAFYDSLQNACLTTLEPIYAELFDHNDPNARKTNWDIGGVKRRVFMAEWGVRGAHIDDAIKKKAEQQIANALKTRMLSPDIHWIKLVVAGMNGKVDTLALTLDGDDDPTLMRSQQQTGWPAAQDFYMAKLFIVVGGA